MDHAVPFSRRFGFAKSGLVYKTSHLRLTWGSIICWSGLLKRGYLEDNWKGLRAELLRLARVTLVRAILAVYAFRGAADGVAHGDAAGGAVTPEVAEWVLSQVAAHITYLADFRASTSSDVAF